MSTPSQLPYRLSSARLRGLLLVSNSYFVSFVESLSNLSMSKEDFLILVTIAVYVTGLPFCTNVSFSPGLLRADNPPAALQNQSIALRHIHTKRQKMKKNNNNSLGEATKE